jgi:hypothetical protein
MKISLEDALGQFNEDVAYYSGLPTKTAVNIYVFLHQFYQTHYEFGGGIGHLYLKKHPDDGLHPFFHTGFPGLIQKTHLQEKWITKIGVTRSDPDNAMTKKNFVTLWRSNIYTGFHKHKLMTQLDYQTVWESLLREGKMTLREYGNKCVLLGGDDWVVKK